VILKNKVERRMELVKVEETLSTLSLKDSLKWNPKECFPMGPSVLRIKDLKINDTLDQVKELLQKQNKAEDLKWIKDRSFLMERAVEYIESNFLQSNDNVFQNLNSSVLQGLYSILSTKQVDSSAEATILHTKLASAKIVSIGEKSRTIESIETLVSKKTGWRIRGTAIQYPSNGIKLTKEQETVFYKLQIMIELGNKNSTNSEETAKAINSYILTNAKHFAPIYYIPTSPDVIDTKMNKLFETWKTMVSMIGKESNVQKQKVVYFASYFHQYFVLVRPFPVCNGKIARILTNCLLVRFGLPAFWFKIIGEIGLYDHSVIKSVKARETDFIKPLYRRFCKALNMKNEKKQVKEEMKDLEYKFL